MPHPVPRPARPLAAAGALIAVTMLAGGCSTSATANRSLDSVHQPVVADDVVDYLVRADGGQLSQPEATRFADWLSAIDARYGDTIAVDRAAAFGSGMAVDAIADLVARRGLLLEDAAPGMVPSADPGVIRVVVRRTRATVPGCPDHATKSSRNFNNATSSNFGCASNSNMAAMIADPDDLIRGATSTATDPRTSGKAIRSWRSRGATPGAGTAPAPAPAGGNGGGQ